MSSQNTAVLRKIIRKSGVTRTLRGALGPEAYRHFRKSVKGIASSVVDRRVPRQRIIAEQRLLRLDATLYRSDGALRRPLHSRMPEQIRKHHLDLVSGALSSAGIDWAVVRNDSKTRITIAVQESDRAKVIGAISRRLRDEAIYVQDTSAQVSDRRLHLAGSLDQVDMAQGAKVLRFATFFEDRKTRFRTGMGYGCDVEFWQKDNLNPSNMLTPRRNSAAQLITVNELRRETVTIGRDAYPTYSIFNKRMLDDITFPIDAVYTWVDGDDPEWIESKRRLEAKLQGIEYHEEANHAARFRSRDELKYSLRSLEMYAPWFRKIFLVTNGQRPSWLNVDDPRIELVTHDDIYDDKSNLPTFNSNSIISRLHHIPGLSEHYVYINDDVFFGRPVSPDQFFLPSGLAKVSPSNNRRPFGEPSVMDEPHINLTRNMRSLLQQEFGITVSRAIKHTPHPQLRSVQLEMEERFPEHFKKTWSSHFRHHEDIVADQLFHYYAQIAGKAVPGTLRYNYINVLDDKYASVLKSTLTYRDRDTFCINDAPVPYATPISEETVADFLESYFPIRSSFEVDAAVLD
jgi:hypothetical protein